MSRSPARRGRSTRRCGSGFEVLETGVKERVQGFANRLSSRELSQAEIDRLRRMANQLRRLSGDPISAQPEAMMKLIDQIELATLAAAAKSRDEASPHTSVPSADSPQYREAVAEYYRRLGGGT